MSKRKRFLSVMFRLGLFTKCFTRFVKHLTEQPECLGKAGKNFISGPRLVR